MSDTRYMRVPTELADKIEKLSGDDKATERAIDQYFEWSTKNMAANLESLDETVLQYMALNVKARNKFKDVAIDVSKDAEKVWEDWYEAMPNVTKKVDAMRAELQPLISDFAEISKAIAKIDTWRVDRLLETMTKIAHVDEETKKILSFLANNYTE